MNNLAETSRTVGGVLASEKTRIFPYPIREYSRKDIKEFLSFDKQQINPNPPPLLTLASRAFRKIKRLKLYR